MQVHHIDLIHRESFGYQLAYARDVLAGLTQTELAKAVNERMEKPASFLDRRQIALWEGNERLELITPYILSAIVEVIGDAVGFDLKWRDECHARLTKALEKSRQPSGNRPAAHAIDRELFGSELARLREELLQASQSHFSALLQSHLQEKANRGSPIGFHSIMNIEHGSAPSPLFLDCVLAVLRSNGVSVNDIESLRKKGEQLLRDPRVTRPLESVNSRTLRNRAGEILFCCGHAPPDHRGGRPNRFGPQSSRTYRSIQKATGINASWLSAFFAEGRIASISLDTQNRLVNYMIDQGAPPQLAQELQLILEELNLRRNVGQSRGERMPPL